MAVCLLRELHNKDSMKCLTLESKLGMQNVDMKQCCLPPEKVYATPASTQKKQGVKVEGP